MELTLEAQKRPEGSKPNALRRQGLIPAVVYGHKGAESWSLTVNAKSAEMLLRDVSINNTLVQLNIPDLSWSGKTLLREVQSHPAKGNLYHLSFFAVSAQASLEVEVPLHFVGDAIGVRLEGGILDPVITVLKVKTAPDSIPEFIEVDVSNLHRGEALHIHELVLPAGVNAIDDPGRVVATVVVPQGDSDDNAN